MEKFITFPRFQPPTSIPLKGRCSHGNGNIIGTKWHNIPFHDLSDFSSFVIFQGRRREKDY